MRNPAASPPEMSWIGLKPQQQRLLPSSAQTLFMASLLGVLHIVGLIPHSIHSQ